MPTTEMIAEKSSTAPEAWQRIGSKRIFFGHQSVGGEIVDGVKMLAAEKGLDINIVRSKDPASVAGPVFVEHPIGENGDPASKARDFAAIVKGGFGEEGGIAFFKYCFLDIDPSTDVKAMFEDYRQTMAEISRAYPKLQIVHVTIPLTTIESGPVALAKQILKGHSRRSLDARRNEFNALLRKEYTGKAPVFDLAQIESTRADGTRATFKRSGATVYALAPEWTYDGSHLNEAGRRIAARHLLDLLAQL